MPFDAALCGSSEPTAELTLRYSADDLAAFALERNRGPGDQPRLRSVASRAEAKPAAAKSAPPGSARQRPAALTGRARLQLHAARTPGATKNEHRVSAPKPMMITDEEHGDKQPPEFFTEQLRDQQLSRPTDLIGVLHRALALLPGARRSHGREQLHHWRQSLTGLWSLEPPIFSARLVPAAWGDLWQKGYHSARGPGQKPFENASVQDWALSNASVWIPSEEHLEAAFQNELQAVRLSRSVGGIVAREDVPIGRGRLLVSN